LTSNPSPADAADPRTGEFPIDPALTAPSAKGLGRLAVPGPRVLLAGILVTRLILVALVLGRELGRVDPKLGSIALVAAAAVAASVWLGWRMRRPTDVPGPSALLLQAAVDVVVITSLISFTPAAATSVAALYVAATGSPMHRAGSARSPPPYSRRGSRRTRFSAASSPG